ncbi:PREDICTED: uncharacterized protein LOC109207161 [Nicotiana attenuata]|uniref:uncharacterized protein LOC109207161 n=1 Tax=Nicotiana attenuata TaxID=49451 RepID=UPI000904802A|nr:PREDICTED: uncharacterized protein LOC109207161 [Nicotiana attenuata]
MVDDFSRSTWTHLLSCKSNTFHAIKGFLSLIENQFDTSVKIIRSDNDLEFVNNENMTFFQEKGIIHQKTCPYTPQQNGVVERKHKYLLETARALLYQSKLPIKYWGECTLTATFIINELPSNVLNNKSPFELLYNKKPNFPSVLHLLSSKNQGVCGLHDKDVPISVTDGPAADTTFTPPLSSPLTSPNSPSSIISNHDDIPNLQQQSTETHDASPPIIEPDNPQMNPPNLIRSGRTHTTPAHLKDYVYSLPTLQFQNTEPEPHTSTTSFNAICNNNHHVSFNVLQLESQQLIRNISHDCEPSSYEEAVMNPAWQMAMTPEFEALYANHT